ncbi:hypothetical protein BASA61_002404 [Batrachochytrium salamandrivorans]|nr:hypothetical protein BASA61_002404 [Batrachochytrium salamandrivorans]
MQFTTIFIAATMAVAASATCTKDCPTTTQVDVSPPAEKTNVPTDEYTVETPSTEETDEDTETPEDDEYPVEETEETQRLLMMLLQGYCSIQELTTKTTAPSASNKTAKYEDTDILSGASSTTLSGAVILAAVAAFF